MTAFAGIAAFDDAPYDSQTEDRIGRSLGAPRTDRIVTRRAPGAVFAQRAAADTAGQSASPPFAGADNALFFAADARLDNRAELGAALAIPPPALARTPDGALILQTYRRWGAAGVARCLGAFVFALWDAGARRLILGRDCLGNRLLFFHRNDNRVAFATTLGALLALPDVPREIDELTLANFMVLNLAEPRRTFYRGIERVPSRTLVTIERASIHHRYYWSPDLDAPPPYRRDEDYIERARELLDQAVAAATADMPQVAIATSGGLDSSAVAATMARLGRAERITCYTVVPPAGTQIDIDPRNYLDERDKVEALGRMHPALNLRFVVPDRPHPLEQDNTRLFARAHIPVLGAPLIGMTGYMRDAVVADGHRALVYGTSGNFGLSWAGYFSLLALLRGGRLPAFTRDLTALARYNRRGLAKAFAGEVIMPSAPAALRRLIYRLRGRAPDSVARYSSLNAAFIADHDLVRRWREQGFDPWFGANGWNPARHRANYLFDHNQIGHDFRGMSEDVLGYETRDPHGDRRLLEFLLAVPEPMYRRDGVPRSFAREVLADRLPPEIIHERRIGASGVTWFRVLSARRAEIAAELERLDASPLARRMVDLPRLKRLVGAWPDSENAAELRRREYRNVLTRGVHIGSFIRWVEGGNA